MRYTTLKNKRNFALSAVESLFTCAELMGMPGWEISGAFSKIMHENADLPRWAKEYLQGVFDTRWKDLYRHKLVFGGYYNGVFYSTHSRRDDYYGKHGIEPGQWADNVDNGVLKVTHYWVTTAAPKPFGEL